MGHGIGAFLKGILPMLVYGGGIIAFFAALSGKARWTLLFLTVIIPLRNVIDHIHGYPLGAQIITLLVISLIFGGIFSRDPADNKISGKPLLNIPAVIFIIYITISLIIGDFTIYGGVNFDIGDSRLQDWKNSCLLPILFWVTFNTIKDKKWAQRLFWAMCFTMIFMDYYMIKQEYWYSSLISRDKITATFQYLGPNEVAAFYNQYTMVLMGVYFFIKEKRKKLFLLALILINIYCVIFTFSRGAYLGLGFGMLVLFSFKNRKLLIPLLLLFVFWQHLLPEKSVERIKGTTNEFGQLDDSSEFRVLIWKQSMAMFQKSPLVGLGYGVFRTLGLILGDTHNIYVKILVEQGLLGMFVFLFVIFAFIRTGFKLYQKGEDGFAKGLGIGLIACITTMLVNNFFGDRWSYFELSAYLWILAGLASRLIVLDHVVKEEEIKTVSAPIQKKKLRYYDL